MTRKQKLQKRFSKVVIVEDASELEAAKQSTENIEYGCNFNDEGLCTPYYGRPNTQRNHMACCTGCQNAIGHFYSESVMSKEQLTFLKRRYSLKTGYWRKGVGCVIPRKWRSTVCLSCRCSIQKEHREHARAVMDTIYVIERGLRWPNVQLTSQ